MAAVATSLQIQFAPKFLHLWAVQLNDGGGKLHHQTGAGLGFLETLEPRSKQIRRKTDDQSLIVGCLLNLRCVKDVLWDIWWMCLSVFETELLIWICFGGTWYTHWVPVGDHDRGWITGGVLGCFARLEQAKMIWYAIMYIDIIYHPINGKNYDW